MPPVATLTAVLIPDGEGFAAHCPEVGTASEGKTIEETVANLKAATELYLAEFPADLPSFAIGRRILVPFEVAVGHG
ncbi:MAG: type II toxin-antitoxin system HicB family antitoxin [Thermoplasmatota archaeon]